MGSSFSIILPLKETTDNIDIPAADEKLVMGNESVLLIDDEERILTVGREICKALGYSVITAASGKEALRIYKARKNEIHLVILDMIMPDMDGGLVFNSIKAIDPEVKVLLSSGYSEEGEAASIMERGCDGFIQKPFKIDSLSMKVRQILSL